MKDEMFAKLIDRMNLNVVKHHNTQTRRDYLKELYTEEQAAFLADFPLGAYTGKALSEKLNRDEDELKKMLEQMSADCLIFEAKNENGEPEYSVLAWEPGLSEFMLWLQRKETDQDKIQKFKQLHDRMHEEDRAITEAFINNPEAIERAKLSPKMARLLPIEENVAHDKELASWERITEIIESETSFAVGECLCKARAADNGEPCQSEILECCIWFGKAGDYLIERDLADRYTKEEVYKVIKECQDAGLVQFTANKTLSGNIILCNCCKCCCPLLKAHKEILDRVGIPLIENTNFVCQVDEDTCTGCEECVDYCQLEALSMNDNIVSVSKKRCLGCGVCVSKCPTESLSLTRISNYKPPVPEPEIVGTGV